VSLDDIVFWHWLVFGLVLLIVEMVLPTGFVLLWTGVSALLVGVLAWLLPTMGWPLEFALFGVLSVVTVLAYRRFRAPPAETDQPTLNRRGASYVNRNFTLTEPIVNGVGKLRVDDSQWRISGPDVAAGTQVRVVAVDGTTLQVERAHQ
jgi:membrane protein implicated in regulation of membrane protease activity